MVRPRSQMRVVMMACRSAGRRSKIESERLAEGVVGALPFEAEEGTSSLEPLAIAAGCDCVLNLF